MIKTTFLLFPLSCSLGNTLRVTNVTVVQWPTLSNPVHPGVSATLQCSVLSDSEDKKCPGEHSVHWFGVRSDKSYPNIIYTDGNEQNECKKTSDTKKSCVYHLSKNFSSSDAGIYYCAVATCGEILFGDGTKLNIEGRHQARYRAQHVTGDKGIMRISFACLLLLSATVSSENDRYKKFKNQHINKEMIATQCNEVINNREINEHDKKCKQKNTFIREDANEVKGLCENLKTGDSIKSLQKFSIIVCELEEDSPIHPNCNYQSKEEVKSIEIACEGGFPVHYVKDIA
ncbi:hypothetical protein F7725_010479 [Dissostichus mawsoni]|uniref:Ig-like domain-containing protein n=1 Tax=Dissostichus mawsoni TaxID=36200 RepID=A0A7J5XQ59_DISMA|nr:hypothetical protein F7725_010477 [Dissostichus mawsoni]KAF3838711.1 hypothetical protein F7725_010479 [Dissostichus mawsoni]